MLVLVFEVHRDVIERHCLSDDSSTERIGNVVLDSGTINHASLGEARNVVVIDRRSQISVTTA